MSGSVPAAAAAASAGGGSGTSDHFFQNLGNLGLGYAIAIALGFLVLLSTILLASYICCRATRNPNLENPIPTPNPNGVMLPRIIFVAEDDEEDEAGGATTPGLDHAVINSYPKFPFSNSKQRSDDDSLCSICLCEYREGEMLRMLPDCHHFFHLSCVDAWLRLNASCPVCRTSPLPTPLSTPLSEVVPLSQYAANQRR
ncbi:hypothetical protein H6P81_011636 [Aristolochia fimbriata]|uniref:RING-type domain-containing protein n=1 Tax=Aristolochia fimbriata TaxID=158543 RepID=A0AAV7E9M5_ARIFI|nr:hypothetical protein H6P81_011636 [Aristolochia fimbriata]